MCCDPWGGYSASAMAVSSVRPAVLLLLVIGPALVGGSEFPERECCDSIPPLPAQFTTPPVSVGTDRPEAALTTTHKSTAIHTKTASTTINCKLARQLCEKDRACSSITSIIPRLCGQELVACSTVTVTKCRAALRTLVSFQFFQPTCLCKEPRVDPECNKYRNLVFDHPCFNTGHPDKDPYPVHALPTCGYALDVCMLQPRCARVHNNYVESCRFQEDACLMTNRSACFEAWKDLKMSPVFGCICPNLDDDDCESIYSRVHKNPCIDSFPEHWHNSTTRYRMHQSHHPAPRRRRLQHVGSPPPYPFSANPARMPARVSAAPPPTRPTPSAVASPGRVSVQVLAGANAGRRYVDPLLVAAMLDPTVESPRTSIMERTLHGDDQYLDHSIGGSLYTTAGVPVTGGHHTARDNVLQSSCHTARHNCQRDARCRAGLEPVLDRCDDSVCDRRRCMARLQHFYSQNSTLVMDVAFCVCRRSPDGDDTCLDAMQQLHPTCVGQPESGRLPSCHSVVRQCHRQPDGRCRNRLQHFEQACAVDVLTKRCAGPTADCRQALLAVLGTQLRSRCSCQQAAAGQRHGCRGWQRLLWANPCVVETQVEFHRERAAAVHRLLEPPVTRASPRPPPRRTTATTTTSATTTTTAAAATAPRSTARWRATPAATPPPTQRRRVTSPPDRAAASCTSIKPGGVQQRIAVGSGIRYYRVDESADSYSVEKDCSELCMCHGHDQLVCNVLDCVEKKSCQSSMALYPHGSDGVLPFRHGCTCYQGDFVCMRPSADDYTLPFGVFLFLGYSQKDVDLLHPHTHKTVEEHTVPELERMLAILMKQTGQSFREWPCKLSVRQHFEGSENIIIQAKLDEVEANYNHSLSQDLLNSEKDKCSGPLRDITYMINNREPEILSHPLLSVFKMAEVDITIPDTSAAPNGPGPVAAMLSLTALTAVLA